MLAYYNEIDHFAAEWLRQLIANGLIAPGEVDERSIEDVTPNDLKGFAQCHFFAGIGVWSYALRQAGWTDDRPVWTGSCPCQPFSAAGKGDGFADERHLWPVWHWLISQCNPNIIFGEQVANGADQWIDLVSTDLEGEGYACGAVDIPACGVGAPHIRQRRWFVAERLANTNSEPCKWDARSVFRTEEEISEERFKDGGQPNRSANGSEIDRLANSKSKGLEGRKVEPARQECQAIERNGDVNGLANTESIRSNKGSQNHERGDKRSAAQQGTILIGNSESDTIRLADTKCDKWDRGRASKESVESRKIERFAGFCNANEVNGFWSGADWLYCRDGKYRPVEPGTFPLASRSTARVEQLRGYGNAINAEVAKEFIKIFLE